MRDQIIFYLNGKKIIPKPEQLFLPLSDFLRDHKYLTGTKVVCSEGDCGACTILKYFPKYNNFLPINACITNVAQQDCSSLITIEGLEENKSLHNIQKSMINSHGTQCGFCTPGHVMSIAGLVEKKIYNNSNDISEKEVKDSLTGNLCRCTGYTPIIKAGTSININETKSLKKRYLNQTEVNDINLNFEQPIHVTTKDTSYFAPKTLSEAFTYLSTNPNSKITGALTDLGVLQNKKHLEFNHRLSLHLIEEMYQITLKNNKITVGARVTINTFRQFLKNYIPQFSHYLNIFASPQIKNIATIVGNIANASPVGDSPTPLIVLDAQLSLESVNGKRNIDLRKFYTSYKKTDLNPNEIITSISFNLPGENSDLQIFKNSIRKDLDISAVNMAILIDWSDKPKNKIKTIKIACGGVAGTIIELKQTQVFLENKTIESKAIDDACDIFQSEFTPINDIRGSASYRRVVLENKFKRFLSSFIHEGINENS